MDSIQRNLQNALPEMIAQLRNAPEDLPATFKLYRNLDALYDVLGRVVESAGAFGSKDDFQALSNDLNSFEGTRKQLAERMENLAASKEQEIVRLRTDLKTAQAAIPARAPEENCCGRHRAAEEAGGEEEAGSEEAGDEHAEPTAAPAQNRADASRSRSRRASGLQPSRSGNPIQDLRRIC